VDSFRAKENELTKQECYEQFLRSKMVTAPERGIAIDASDINPMLKPHQAATVRWGVHRGCAGIFEAFGLGKTFIQLEIARLIRKHAGGKFLIVAPLGVRQEFRRDAQKLGIEINFVRRFEECRRDGIFLTNYETIRDSKMDPRKFTGCSLDEAAILRGFGGTKTFREFMRVFENGQVRYKFVATATPSPNEYIELLAYAAFLDVMDVSQAKTRFFKRDSTHADNLTLHAHKEREFWLWVSSWAMFLQRPSDLGFSDEGYELPPMHIHWHEIPSDHTNAGHETSGQGRLVRSSAVGVTHAAKEKRESLTARVEKLMELRALDPTAHRIIWHDLEAERHAIEKAIPTCGTAYGSQDLDERERIVMSFADGDLQELAGKPSMLGAGNNFQRYCAWSIFLGIGFKFHEFIQAVHRTFRFLQERPVRLDLIYTEAEREVRRVLQDKWDKHVELVAQMSGIIREYGLATNAMEQELGRTLGTKRQVGKGESYEIVLNDSVLETMEMPDASVHLILSSIPFATQYEYTPSFNDFGHSENNEQFWEQMDFLTPELFRVLQPGRVSLIHVKDRIIPGGLNGMGFQTVYPFHSDAIRNFCRHGFGYMGMVTIVTDVVRENGQTYRLGWTEQCKDGTKMGVGMPEYLLLFRKPPSDSSNGYADLPVIKNKADYSRHRWQVDAHGFHRSSGNRLLTREDIRGMPHERIFKLFRQHSLENVYDYEEHVQLGEVLEVCAHCQHIHLGIRGDDDEGKVCGQMVSTPALMSSEALDAGATAEICHCPRYDSALPKKFMLLQPQSWHQEVWTDITRMLSLNSAQSAAGREMHLCLADDSLVLTKERGYIPIKTVQVGEQVLTHKGRWRTVLVSRSTGKQTAVDLRAHGVTNLRLTPDHSLWVRNAGKYARQRQRAERVEPTWLEAVNAQSSYVNLKLPPTENPSSTDRLLWWTVGRWLADGHWSSRDSAVISCGRHEKEALQSALGKYGGNQWNDCGTALQIILKDKDRALRDILEKCGHGASGKHLPSEALTLPQDQANDLLDGYFSGDGHQIKSRNRQSAPSISRALLLGIAVLVQRVHGAIATICPGRPSRLATIQGRLVQCKQEWVLSFDLPQRRRKRQFILEDGAWKKVRSIKRIGSVETWNLRVEEDESFTAEGCIVKNCPMQYDLADRAIVQYTQPGEIVFDPFAGLGTVPMRAVRLGRRGLGVELSPRYFADAVYYCETAERKLATPSLFDLTEQEDATMPA
jgi:DNA modification methylase